MMRYAILLSLILAAPLSAQDGDAEALYRDAWWRETSKADVAGALEVYRKAVDASGPEEIRARALLKVAEMLKRLGKTEQAMRTLDGLRERFPAQKEVLATADERAKEWTAVDLRESYSEWYRRYLFSPEFQKKVVDDVLNRDASREWLLRIGEAAVPALQQAVQSKDDGQASWALEILLQLGELPPAPVLLRHRDWALDADAWLAVLRASDATRTRARRELSGADPLAVVLGASLASPDDLVKAMAGPAGAELSLHQEKIARAVLTAMFLSREPAMHRSLADLAVHPKSPRSLRPLAVGVLTEGGWLGATAKDWLEWSRDAEKFQHRVVGIAWAGRVMGADEADTIDAILDDVEELRKLRPDLGVELANAFGAGLLENGLAQQFAWTPDRIRRFILLCLESNNEDTPLQFLMLLRNDRRLGLNVAEAILQAPESFPFDPDRGYGVVEQVYYFDLDEADSMLAAVRWDRWVTRGILRRWKEWKPEQRLQVLRMTKRGLLETRRGMRGLGVALTEMASEVPLEEPAAKLVAELRAWPQDEDE